MEDFPPNSHKDKERPVQPGKKVVEKKVEKVVKLDVVPRKKSLGTKFKEVFVGGESRAALRYIGHEVLLPALRNMIVDATTKGIERVIYGDSSPRRSSYAPNSRVSYNNPGNRYQYRSPVYNEPPRSGRSAPRYEVMELIFGSREEAESVLEALDGIIEQYEMASVADLHELAGLPSTHTDNKWGWVSLRGTRIKQIRDGFVIDFPPVETI